MPEPKPLARADAYIIKHSDGGISWDLDGLAIDMMILIKVAKISREGVHQKMDELYDEVEADIDFPTEGNA